VSSSAAEREAMSNEYLVSSPLSLEVGGAGVGSSLQDMDASDVVRRLRIRPSDVLGALCDAPKGGFVECWL